MFPQENHFVLILCEAGDPMACAGQSLEHMGGRNATEQDLESCFCYQNRALALGMAPYVKGGTRQMLSLHLLLLCGS